MTYAMMERTRKSMMMMIAMAMFCLTMAAVDVEEVEGVDR